MRIYSTMNLYSLGERMGTCATYADALIMRLLLIERYPDGETDTQDVSEDVWDQMLKAVAKADQTLINQACA